MPDIVYVEANGRRHVVDAPIGMSIMEAARGAGVPGIDADCGGVQACATCHVYVDEAWRDRTGEPSADEQTMLECATDPGEGSRLSCQIVVGPNLTGSIYHIPATQR